MPCFLVKNIATELGLSNNCDATFVRATYTTRNGQRQAVSCILHVPSYSGSDEENPHKVEIGCYDESLMVESPTHGRLRWKRRQLPVIPAFAFTAHNAQGRTLDRACLDLASCPSTMSAYVMLSRLRTLEGLSVLRPFDTSKSGYLRRHISQSIREELQREERLADETEELARESLAWYFDRL